MSRSWVDIGLYCAVQTCWIVILSMQYAWLRYYYFNYLHMDLIVMNAMIAIAAAGVFALTPFMAYYADVFIAASRLVACSHRFTNRRVLLSGLALLYCTTNYLLFAVPASIQNTQLTVWVCAFYGVNQFAYSLIALNWASFGMRMSRSRRERSNILLLSTTTQTIISVPFAIIIGNTDANGFRTINSGFTLGLAATMLCALWFIDIYDDLDETELIALAMSVTTSEHIDENNDDNSDTATGKDTNDLDDPVVTNTARVDDDSLTSVTTTTTMAPMAAQPPLGAPLPDHNDGILLQIACMFRDPPFQRIFLCTLFAYTYMMLPRDALILQAYFGLSQSDIGRNGAIIQSVAVVTTIVVLQVSKNRGFVRAGMTKERLYALLLGAWAFLVGLECLQITPGDANNNASFWILLLADAIFSTPQVSLFQSVVSDAVVYNKIHWKRAPNSNLILIMVNNAGFFGQIGTSVVYVILDRVGLHSSGDLVDNVADAQVTTAIRWILFASAMPTLCLSLWPLLWPRGTTDGADTAASVYAHAETAQIGHIFFPNEPHLPHYHVALACFLGVGVAGFVYAAAHAGLDSLYFGVATLCIALCVFVLILQIMRIRMLLAHRRLLSASSSLPQPPPQKTNARQLLLPSQWNVGLGGVYSNMISARSKQPIM